MATPTKITNAEQAVVAMRDRTYDPYALADYLKQSLFGTIVDPGVKTASVRDYYARLFNQGHGNIVRFQYSKPSINPFAPLRVWFVPRVSVDRLVTNNNKFPFETLATIDLANPQARIICTEKLTGCCFVIGWDNNKNGRLYLGHIEPSETKDRSYIAKYVREKEVLPVPKSKLSKYICFGGDDDQLPSSYNNYTVNIIGFISSDRIWMAFQVLHPESGQQVRESMLMDFNLK